jgi:hypothetical protein
MPMMKIMKKCSILRGSTVEMANEPGRVTIDITELVKCHGKAMSRKTNE